MDEINILKKIINEFDEKNVIEEIILLGENGSIRRIQMENEG